MKYCNTVLARHLGFAHPDEIIGRMFSTLFKGTHTHSIPRLKAELSAAGQWEGKLSVKRKQGLRIPLSGKIALLANHSEEVAMVGTYQDKIAENNHLEQIRRLTADADRSLEQERSRISQELHDQLGQLLTAVNMDLSWLASNIGNTNPSASMYIQEALGFVRDMTTTVRHVCKSLRPLVLDHQGLSAAIQSYVAGFERLTGIRCHVINQRPDLKIADPAATILFRVVQEALTNVARHARSPRCKLMLTANTNHVELLIRDYGIGSDDESLTGVNTLGIIGMKERVSVAGGSLTVENAACGGVRVVARLPMPRKQEYKRP